MFSDFKNFRYQSFKQLKNDCVKADNLFNDGLFGADHLCLDINGTMQNRILQWLRPKDIYPDPRLGIGGATKGKFSSSAVVAALSAVSTRLPVKEQILPKDQEWNSEKPHLYRGIFHFHFHYFGQWTDVVIDDRLPTQKHKLVYTKAEHENEFWPSLVEKAYAKLHGGYNVIERIPVTDILSDLTGGVSEVLDLGNMTSSDTSAAEEWVGFFDMVEEAHGNNTIFIATKSAGEVVQSTEGEEDKIFSERGILENGLYPIAESKKLNVGTMFKRDYIYLLKLVSPVEEIFTGPYSDDSVQMASLPDQAKKELKTTSPRQFWITVADFFEEFSHLIVNHVINTSFLALNKTWRKEQFRSWWGDDRAGGFNGDKGMFIRCNHQYLMTITDDEVVVLIELTQKPQYTGAVSSSNPFDDGSMPAFKKIGFAILEIEANREYRLHRTHYEPVQTSEFICTRSVSLRVNLPTGRYCVIPCTYDGSSSGEFVLRFFTTKTIDVRQVVEEMPSRHWLLKCFLKPYLAGVSFTVRGLQMIEGILGLGGTLVSKNGVESVAGYYDNPEALDSLAEQELYVQLECEKSTHMTSQKYGVTWNEQFTVYLVSPVTAALSVKVFKKNMIGSSMVGCSSIQLPELFGSVKTIDDTRDKEFNMRLKDKHGLNLEIHLRMTASFFTDLMEI
ncbi:hypothetical protein ACHWQZ_G000412 [Mnemiopsis leidyi]